MSTVALSQTRRLASIVSRIISKASSQSAHAKDDSKAIVANILNVSFVCNLEAISNVFYF